VEQNHSWEADSKYAQQVKKFSAFYGIRMSITVFTRARLRLLSWARWIQSTAPNTVSLRFILILSSHLCLCSEWSLPFRLSNQNFVRISHLPNAHHVPRPSHTLWCDHINNSRRRRVLIWFLKLPLMDGTENCLHEQVIHCFLFI
jgi:hypothetical protein